MRAVIIDPWNKSVYVTDEEKWGLEQMYKHLSGPDGFRPCHDIDHVRVGRDQLLWLDGEGLLIPDVPVWNLRDYPRPLAGKGLILGIDEEGENKATFLEAAWVESMILWTPKLTTGQLGEMTNPEPNVFVMGEPILKEG